MLQEYGVNEFFAWSNWHVRMVNDACEVSNVMNIILQHYGSLCIQFMVLLILIWSLIL